MDWSFITSPLFFYPVLALVALFYIWLFWYMRRKSNEEQNQQLEIVNPTPIEITLEEKIEPVSDLVSKLIEMKHIGILKEENEDYKLSELFNQRRNRVNESNAIRIYRPLFKVAIPKADKKELGNQFVNDAALDTLTILGFVMEKEKGLAKSIEETKKEKITYWQKFLNSIDDTKEKFSVLGQLGNYKSQVSSYVEIVQTIRAEAA